MSEDYTASQALAASARSAAVDALVVPSAALPGTSNLVLLGPRVMSQWLMEPVDDVDVPSAVAADRAGAPLAVLPHVRWRGEPHAALDAWRAGASFTLPEAVTTPV